MSLDGLLDCCVDVVLDVVLGVEDVDGEGAARDGEAGHVPEKVGELLRVHRRRRHDQLQVGPTRNHRSESFDSNLYVTATYDFRKIFIIFDPIPPSLWKFTQPS